MSKKVSIKTRIERLLVALNQGVYEKEDIIRLSLLSAIAGESIFLLGAPGTAKSLVARRLKMAFADAKGFDYLMSRFSTPDELFGPVSISKLKNEDKYERVVARYLPDSEVVFLDEIWKASPAIQNTLLTILNEKVFRNGEQEVQVPMKALIAASNELPAENEGLEALYDRFLVRYEVKSIVEKSNFEAMITMKPAENTVAEGLKISGEDYALWQVAIADITMPDNVLNVINVIRNYMSGYNENQTDDAPKFYVSDRRWHKIVNLLRTSAFLNDRSTVDLMDCFLIQNCVWDKPEQQTAVASFLKEAIQKHGYTLILDLKTVKKQIDELTADVKKETSYVKEEKGVRNKLIDGKYYEIIFGNQNIRDESYTLILKNDFNKLKQNTEIAIKRYLNNGNHNHYDTYAKAHKHNTAILLKDNYHSHDYRMFEIATEEHTNQITLTKKPHTAVAKEWDKTVAKILTYTNDLKAQIQHYRNTDLKHVRTNLFVDAQLADIVESHLFEIQKNIEKLEIDTKQIQHDYQNVEPDKQLEIKQLN
ncbi:MAG: hypothetical protein RI894_666 [Bacteroidota bacterium]|jgi:MoxR-like ATPase